MNDGHERMQRTPRDPWLIDLGVMLALIAAIVICAAAQLRAW